MSRALIGGEIELPGRGPRPDPSRLLVLTKGVSGTWTASGRSALALTLSAFKPRRLLLPSYLCDSLLLPARQLGIETALYPVDDLLRGAPQPRAGEAALVIHYFGWLNPAADALRPRRGDRHLLIEDASHALLSAWRRPEEGTAVLLSPRKFGPTSAGGWTSVRAEPGRASREMERLCRASLSARRLRGRYLSRPAAAEDPVVERRYLRGLEAFERYLDAHPMQARAPKVALDAVAAVDWAAAAAARRRNWRALDARLRGEARPLFGTLPEGIVPLGYVIRCARRDELRRRLAARRIFTAVHWPELPGGLLTLPVDQRYGAADMSRLADEVLYELRSL